MAETPSSTTQPLEMDAARAGAWTILDAPSPPGTITIVACDEEGDEVALLRVRSALFGDHIPDWLQRLLAAHTAAGVLRLIE